MSELSLGDQVIGHDWESTIAVYEKVPVGHADRCGCDPCRNFSRQRNRAYPPPFLELLRLFGVDPNKEAEVYECGAEPSGMHIYGGWFYFVGRLIAPGEYLAELENFKYYFG